MSRLIDLAERSLVPDCLIRRGIRRIIRARDHELRAPDCEARLARKLEFFERLRAGPIARVPAAANAQHYEVPPAVFERALGPRLKYSGCLWRDGTSSLAQAEVQMLALTCARADIRDGMSILELGCGWGSLTLWIAERYPNCEIVAMSNSTRQRDAILRKADEAGVRAPVIITADINDFEIDRRFDRVVSVEMFEHLWNYERALERIARWLTPEGRLFVHHFCHREAAYPYEDAGADDWMARNFFTGGIMPSDDQLLHFQRDLEVEARWRVSGVHYQRTAEAWLAALDRDPEASRGVLAGAYGPDEAARWLQRWRMFFMACAELFGFAAGESWWVTHCRMAPRAR